MKIGTLLFLGVACLAGMALPAAPVQSGTLTLAQSVDQPDWTFTTGGSANWFPQAVDSFDGQHAARSGDIDNGQATWLETNVQGPGTLRFWWKVSSEHRFDVLRVSINGVTQVEISGPTQFADQSFDLAAGMHVIRWTYEKDVSVSDGEDSGWVDQVQVLHPVTPTAGENGSISPAAVQMIERDASTTFTVVADAGYVASAGGSCGGTLDGTTYTTDPITAACTVEASFMPGTTTQLIANPARPGQPTAMNVAVTGTGSASADGIVTVTSSSGESCTSTVADSVSGNTAHFECAITFDNPGEPTIEAVFSGSSTHFGSDDTIVLQVMRTASLGVTADDGMTEVAVGDTLEYLVEVRNTGPDDAPGTRVQLHVTPILISQSWTCTAVGAASCASASGSGDVDNIVQLPANSGVDFVLAGALDTSSEASVTLQATVVADDGVPNYVLNVTPAASSASDVNIVAGIFANGFE